MGLVSSVGAMAFLLALVPTTAQAATQIRDDPSDAPPGAFGKADVRTVAWDLEAPRRSSPSASMRARTGRASALR